MGEAAEQTGFQVYAAISAVMADLAKEGIAKGRKNQQQGFSFRGIDDVYNALASILARHKLVILPRVLSREVVERATAKGGVLFNVVLDVEYAIVSAVDGSSFVARVQGEAMDSADKATNKAMSAAFKYLCLQAFCIPTEGDNDADATTHEPIALTISAEQARQVKSDLQRTGSDVAKFCEVLKIASIDEMPPALLGRAKGMIAAKEKANQEKANAANS